MLADSSENSDITNWQHDLWSWHRLEEGWTYAEKKDKTLKHNPCLKHFSLLTEEEVAWDKMFADLYEKTIRDMIMDQLDLPKELEVANAKVAEEILGDEDA